MNSALEVAHTPGSQLTPTLNPNQDFSSLGQNTSSSLQPRCLLENVPPRMKDAWNPATNGQDDTQAHVKPAGVVPASSDSMETNSQRRERYRQDRQENLANPAFFVSASLRNLIAFFCHDDFLCCDQRPRSKR